MSHQPCVQMQGSFHLVHIPNEQSDWHLCPTRFLFGVPKYFLVLRARRHRPQTLHHAELLSTV